MNHALIGILKSQDPLEFLGRYVHKDTEALGTTLGSAYGNFPSLDSFVLWLMENHWHSLSGRNFTLPTVHIDEYSPNEHARNPVSLGENVSLIGHDKPIGLITETDDFTFVARLYLIAQTDPPTIGVYEPSPDDRMCWRLARAIPLLRKR